MSALYIGLILSISLTDGEDRTRLVSDVNFFSMQYHCMPANK